MAGWLIDKTDLIAIEYDLLREARVGDTVLGILGLGDANEYVSLVPGGVVTGWVPEEKTDTGVGGLTRKVSVLLLSPVTIEILKQAAALQMGEYVYKKQSEVPYDGVGTPMVWVFNIEATGKRDFIEL